MKAGLKMFAAALMLVICLLVLSWGTADWGWEPCVTTIRYVKNEGEAQMVLKEF